MKTETFTYTSVNGGTTSQVSTHRIVCGSMDTTYSYTYDDNGNILEVYDGTSTTSYVYDSANQLVRENNSKYDYTKLWTYDNAGNIRSRQEYLHTTGDLEDAILMDSVNYGYPTVPMVDEGEQNPVWGDLLTSYDGEAIAYETTEDNGKFGNPLNGNGRTYTWEHGRQLSSLTQNGTQWNFEYDAGGMRTKRTNGTTTYEYVYNGSQLTQMTVNDSEVFNFTYDADGTPLTISIGRTIYYYVTNLQGDVVKILDTFGNTLASYTYDAWGVCTSEIIDYLEFYNPLRYRGYVYDEETGLYYLQSRYYDPEVGRFLNADALYSTGQGFVGNNMFAYCGNNPIMQSDPFGNVPAFAIMAVAIITGVLIVITGVAECAMPSEEEHYARNEKNITGIDRVEDVPADWKTSDKNDVTRQRGPAANAHQFTSNDRSNVKYVSPDKKQELIFNSNGDLVTDPKDVGTYNFGTGFVDHYVKDIKPWIRWGNSPDDTTTSWQRMWALVGIY